MRKTALAVVGLGIAYLMRNKDARDKLKKQVESFTTSKNEQQPS